VSLLIAASRGETGFLAVDTRITYRHDDGVVYADECSKAIIFPHANAVVAAMGFMPTLGLIARVAHLARGSFDELVQWFSDCVDALHPAWVEDCVKAGARRETLTATANVVALMGWSEALGRVAIKAGQFDPVAKRFQWQWPMESLAAPSEPFINEHLDSDSDAEILRAAKLQVAHIRAGWAEAAKSNPDLHPDLPAVGGRLIKITVSRDAASTSVLGSLD
jgi:hypothetical protein